jgi:hypothetical protein
VRIIQFLRQRYRFRDLSQQVMPGSFGSVAELVETINLYLAQDNLEPKRYLRLACRRQRSSQQDTQSLGSGHESRHLLKLFKRRYTRSDDTRR